MRCLSRFDNVPVVSGSLQVATPRQWMAGLWLRSQFVLQDAQFWITAIKALQEITVVMAFSMTSSPNPYRNRHGTSHPCIRLGDGFTYLGSNVAILYSIPIMSMI